MPRARIAWLLLLIAVFFELQAAVPSEIPFILLLALMLQYSFRFAFFLACAIGVFLDLYSPLKGISLLSYSGGITASFFLSRHLLTHRSLLSWYVLGLVSWIAVHALKVFLFIVFSGVSALPDSQLLFSYSSLLLFARGFLTASVILLLVYPLVSDHPNSLRSI